MRSILVRFGCTLAALACPVLVAAGPFADAAHGDAVRQLLERAEEAKAYGESGDAVSTVAAWMLPGLSRTVIEATSRPLAVSVWETQPGSLQRSSCHQADILLISILLNEIRESANQGLEDKDLIRVSRLSRLYGWLFERQQQLIRNGTDPLASDDGYWAHQTFESSSSSSSSSSSQPFCYFDTDYLPPTTSGYGCDSATLAAIIANMPEGQPEFIAAAQKEVEALQQIEAALRNNTDTADAFADLQDLFDDTGTGGSSASSSAPPAGHQRLQGCQPDLDPAVVLTGIRGPFSAMEDDRRLVRDHQIALLAIDRDRRLPDELEQAISGSVVMRTLLGEDILLIRDFTRQQTAKGTSLFVMGGDAFRMMQTAMWDLSTSVGKLATLGSTLDGGLRGFVRDFAYFLLRSCTKRPCSEILERVTRAALEDECFPYVSGAYLSDTCEEPRWRKCRDAMPWSQATGDARCE